LKGHLQIKIITLSTNIVIMSNSVLFSIGKHFTVDYLFKNRKYKKDYKLIALVYLDELKL